jgi:hypothetical protein
VASSLRGTTTPDRPEFETTDAPPAEGGGPSPWSRRATALSLLLLLALFVLPLRGLLRSQGPPMEEGFMLVFPERVLHGDLANRDFLHLYGPGSLWVLAGVFKAFGTSLVAERMVALAQQVGLVLAVFFLARYWGKALATVAAVVCLIIIVPPIGLTALAWVGGMALGLLATWAALRARWADPGPARWWALAAGLLAAAALLYRPDLVLATGLGIGVAVWGTERKRWWPLVAGLGAGVAGYLVHAATAGFEASFKGMVLDPVIYLRGGRRLPIPPSPNHIDGFLQRAGETFLLHWPMPVPRTAQQLTIWFFVLLATVAVVVAVGVWRLRKEPGSAPGRILLAVALFSVGLLPQGIQRVDSTHFAWASAIPLAFLPIAITEVLRRRGAHRTPAREWVAPAVGIAVVVAVLVVAVPTFTLRRYADFAVQSFGYHRLSYEISYGGRTFYYGRKDVVRAVEEMLPVIQEMAPPGSRMLVGTGDLRKTPYSDAFLYYMLPDLVPGTYYIEMDPGVANRKGSRLADDVASSDVVVLSTVWDDWDEPNDSRIVGADEPNQVLREQFCLVDEYGGGLYRLYRKAGPGDQAGGRCPVSSP